MTYGATKKSTNMRLLLGVVILIGILASTAFTASNTLPETNAGTGTVQISGYTAESIDYNLNATDPETIDSVDVVITGEVADTSDASLQLTTDGSWYDCSVGTFNDVDNETPLACTTTDAQVATANNLTLVIAD